MDQVNDEKARSSRMQIKQTLRDVHDGSDQGSGYLHNQRKVIIIQINSAQLQLWSAQLQLQINSSLMESAAAAARRP